MESSMIIGFVSIGILLIGNMVAFAYGYGKICQKVKDHHERLARIEGILTSLNTAVSQATMAAATAAQAAATASQSLATRITQGGFRK